MLISKILGNTLLYSVENFTYVTVMDPSCRMHESFPEVTVTRACRIEGNGTVPSIES
jgi:hypothetical protein